MKIKVVGISGSPVKGGNTDVLLEKTLKEIESDDVVTEFIGLAQKQIGGCIHCNWCTRKQTEEKLCALKDDMDAIYLKLLEADVILLATPVYFGRLSGPLADLIDRCRVVVHGSVYKHAFKNKIGAGFALSWFRQGGIESALISLHSAFFILDMIPVSPGMTSVFGGCGVSSYQGEGFCEKGDKLSILKDEFGLEASKKTAERAVEVARLIKAGSQYLKLPNTEHSK
ncbi:MAG TPA: flavodoxin family protein [Negativicutes bacterium]